MIQTGAYVPLEGKTENLHQYFRNSILASHADTIINELVTDEISPLVAGEDIIQVAIDWVNAHEGAKFGMKVNEKKGGTTTPVYDDSGFIAYDVTLTIE